MKYLSLTIIVILQLCFILGCSASSAEENQEASSVQSNSQNDSQVKSLNNMQSDLARPIYITHYPLTNDYYNQFMSSQVEFPVIQFDYVLRPTLEHPEAPSQSLFFQSEVEVVSGQYIDFTLEQLDEFYVFYKDIANEPTNNYEAYLESSMILPVFGLIQENSGYYFDGEEYGEEESLKIYSNRQFGYTNYIYLGIQMPDSDTDYINPYYSFCKGWEPGEDPPAELVPLIDYLESVIIPEMLNHLCDW